MRKMVFRGFCFALGAVLALALVQVTILAVGGALLVPYITSVVKGVTSSTERILRDNQSRRRPPPRVAVASPPSPDAIEKCEKTARRSYIERKTKTAKSYRVYLREKNECRNLTADTRAQPSSQQIRANIGGGVSESERLRQEAAQARKNLREQKKQERQKSRKERREQTKQKHARIQEELRRKQVIAKNEQQRKRAQERKTQQCKRENARQIRNCRKKHGMTKKKCKNLYQPLLEFCLP